MSNLQPSTALKGTGPTFSFSDSRDGHSDIDVQTASYDPHSARGEPNGPRRIRSIHIPHLQIPTIVTSAASPTTEAAPVHPTKRSPRVSMRSNPTSYSSGGGGKYFADAVTAFDFEDRDCPPVINTNATALHKGSRSRDSFETDTSINSVVQPHGPATNAPLQNSNNVNYNSTFLSSGPWGGKNHFQQDQFPMSARSYTATSRRHVTVVAPPSQNNGPTATLAASKAVTIGGLTDDNYFGYAGRNGSAALSAQCISAFMFHPIITATAAFITIATYCLARCAIEFQDFSSWAAGVESQGRSSTASGSLWAGILCAVIVLSAMGNALVLVIHAIYGKIKEARAASAAAAVNKDSSTTSLPSFNNSGHNYRHNIAARLSVTICYASISLCLIALTVIDGPSGGAIYFSLSMPIIGTTTLRPILNTGILCFHSAVIALSMLGCTLFLKATEAQHSDGDWARDTLPLREYLWLQFVAVVGNLAVCLFAVLGERHRDATQVARLMQEQKAVSVILQQLVDLNVESAKGCLDNAIEANPSLADGGCEAFNAAARLINGLTLFRSYVPTAVGGNSEAFSSDEESIPDDDEVLSPIRVNSFSRGKGSPIASSTPHTATVNVSAAREGFITPTLASVAVPHQAHPIPAPLEAHFGVKTTFRKRWVTILHMYISQPNGGLDTTLAEAIGNAVCGPVVDTISAHRGVIEHLGPMSIIVSFNCRVPCVMHEAEAARAASMIAEDLNAIMPSDIPYAVVVASGYCIVGDFGVDSHRAKVILGDAMDLAVRVPPLAIRLGAKVVLTEDTATKLSFDTVPIDNILIGGLNAESRLGANGTGMAMRGQGGKGRSVMLYELRSIEKNLKGKSPDNMLYASGFSAFRCGEFAAAADRFRRYCIANVGDKQAQRILELCNWFALNGIGPRTYLRKEQAWEIFDGELGINAVKAIDKDPTSADYMSPPSPRLQNSSLTHSMRSRESSRDVGELVRQQIMSNPNATLSSKAEFQEDGLFSMFVVPEDGDDADVDITADVGAGAETSPTPIAKVKETSASAELDGGPSSSGRKGTSVAPTTATGSFNYNLSVVNMTTNSGNPATKTPVMNSSAGSSAQPQPTNLDPHEEMLLLSSAVPLEFFDSASNRWKRAEATIGSGAGGAELYLALGEQGNLVALKCFSLASTKTNQEELIQEVSTLSRLRDDYIVGYVSYAITVNHFIILMEYVSGGSLYDLLEQFGPLPSTTARRFMTDILRGLQYLHEQRTTHCDIKPHNALLSTEGSCKLTDFGSCMPAEALHQNMPDDMPLVRGTSWYLAPEAARGEVMHANDIWSIGITLIELLTGSHPWKGKEYNKLNEMSFIIQLGKDPKMVPEIPPTITGAAREFIAACIHRNPADRPTVQELLIHPFIIS